MCPFPVSLPALSSSSALPVPKRDNVALRAASLMPFRKFCGSDCFMDNSHSKLPTCEEVLWFFNRDVWQSGGTANVLRMFQTILLIG